MRKLKDTPTPIHMAGVAPLQAVARVFGHDVAALDKSGHELKATVQWQMENVGLECHCIHFRLYKLKLDTNEFERPSFAYHVAGNPVGWYGEKSFPVELFITPNSETETPDTRGIYVLLGTYKDKDPQGVTKKGAGIYVFKFK